MADTCCVADQYCKSPSNLEPPIHINSKCYCCGQPVCVNCSLVIEYLDYGKQRICHNCLEMIDGDDKRIMEHINKGGE